MLDNLLYKLFDFNMRTYFHTLQVDWANKIMGLIPRLKISDKGSYVQSETKVYDDVSWTDVHFSLFLDGRSFFSSVFSLTISIITSLQMAFKYLSWVLFPLLGGYAIYSLIYVEQRGWYSWVLGMLYGFLLMFGFITMTPQVCSYSVLLNFRNFIIVANNAVFVLFFSCSSTTNWNLLHISLGECWRISLSTRSSMIYSRSWSECRWCIASDASEMTLSSSWVICFCFRGQFLYWAMIYLMMTNDNGISTLLCPLVLEQDHAMYEVASSTFASIDDIRYLEGSLLMFEPLSFLTDVDV